MYVNLLKNLISILEENGEMISPNLGTTINQM